MTNNKLIVPNADFAIQQLKNEIAAELGIQYGADISARDNGRIGGEITKRLIALGELKLQEMSQGINNSNITQYTNNQVDTSHQGILH